MKTLTIILSTLVLCLLATACAADGISPYLLTPELHTESRASYAGMGTEEIIDFAEAILIGRIASVSPTRWNQDSGERWQDPIGETAGLQYYEVTLDVTEAVVDEIGLGDPAVITVLGSNPDPDYSFATGERVLVFLRRGPMAWRGGPVEKLMFAGGPQAKYTLTDDGQALNSLVPGRDTTLQALLDEIPARRKE
jgi:hypothetical protein